MFARDWPTKAFFGLAALFGLWAAVSACQPSAAMFRDWQFVLLFVVSIIVAPVLACFLSLLVGFFFLGPIYHWRATLNGAPFHVGDRVRILVGPHRDRVVQVYAVWIERSQVCVELDELSKTEAKDVFSFTQVCREIAT